MNNIPASTLLMLTPYLKLTPNCKGYINPPTPPAPPAPPTPPAE